MIENHILEQIVEQSSWCQRNWDLSKTIPEISTLWDNNVPFIKIIMYNVKR